MEHASPSAVDELFQAHADSMKAHAHFVKCQARVLFQLDSGTPLKKYVELVDANFGKFIQKPSIEKASHEDFEDAHVKQTYRAPSWTSNEALDEENAKAFHSATFKRRKCV